MTSLNHVPIGTRVRAELTLRGLRGKDLAEQLALPPTSISRRLRGITEFSASEVAAISEWLDVPLPHLFEPLPERPGARSAG